MPHSAAQQEHAPAFEYTQIDSNRNYLGYTEVSLTNIIYRSRAIMMEIDLKQGRIASFHLQDVRPNSAISCMA